MTPYEINQIVKEYTVISGIVFYVVYLVLSYFFGNKALKKIKDNLEEGEYIIYEPQRGYLMEFILIIGAGVFFGWILIFFIYSQIEYANAFVNRQNLPIDIFIALVGILNVFHTACEKLVFTNKRIVYAWAFKFLYVFKGFTGRFENLNYSEIKSYRYENIIIDDSIELYLKNGKRYTIAGYKKLKDVYLIMKKYF